MMKCIKCENKIKTIYEFSEGKVDEGAYKDATGGQFYGGYGSQYDEHGFYFLICDECITTGLLMGTVINK